MGLTLPYSILGQARASASRSCQALGRITKSQPLILRELLLLIHLLCAIAWLGGMFFAYFCLRPAAAEVLKPPDRTFGRFLPYMAFAVTFILASGLAMLVPIGFAAAVPRLRSHCASSAWPEAGRVLNRIRQLVALNLVLGLLGLLVVLSAVAARSA